MKRITRAELRKATHYNELSVIGLSVDLIGDLIDVSGNISTGAHITDRVGNTIARSCCQLRFVCRPMNTAFASVCQSQRVALIWLKAEPQGGWGALTTSYFFGDGLSAPWCAPVNDENSHNFVVLHDEQFSLSCPQEIPAVAQSPDIYAKNLFFSLEGLYSTYAGDLPSTQNGGFLYVLTAASNGGGGLPFASIDIHFKSKFKIKPF